MPTEGLSTRERSSRAGSKTARAHHRATDIAGLACLAVGLILLIALAWQNSGGAIGNGLASLFRLLFGKAAWTMPAFLGLLGVALIFGRTKVDSKQAVIGSLLAFFSVLAALARPMDGDFFVDQAMRQSGGYIGAVFGWALTGLLGAAKPVAIVFLVAAGLVLSLNVPMRELVARIASAMKAKAITDKIRTVTAKEKATVAEAPVKTRRRSVLVEEDEDDDAVPAKPERPLVREIGASAKPKSAEVNLDISQDGPVDGYRLPPLNLLVEPDNKKKRDPKETQRNIELLEDTMDQFGIDASVVAVSTGPTITRYELQPGPGVRVSRITNLADNIALSLAASHVRVEAPIPGKSAIGIEIPNATRQTVTLREMCDSLEFHDQTHKLCLALGKDVSGHHKYTDLTRMPHLLVGGATNSGKSISLATMIMSLIMKMTPRDLRLVMIDPKRVELTFFEGLPHLMCPVVKDVKEAAGVLRAVVREMDRRYDTFSEGGVRNIDGWNAKASYQEKLPYIVVIVDELADLMIQCGAEVETSICRLAQLARATGIHLVIATQRPSVDVITGTIKNNIASRIAFAVSSGIDSRTILDQSGADDLVGRGDMLFLPIDATKPVRIQGCYVSEKEIEDVCNFWREQEKPHYVLNPVKIAIEEKEATMREEQESDPLFQDAVRWVVERGQASTSMMQRKFSIGFQRAGRLMDLMEERGIIGPREGSKPREVLVDPMQLEAVLGNAEYMSPMPDGAYLDDDVR